MSYSNPKTGYVEGRREFLKRAGIAAAGLGLAATNPLLARDFLRASREPHDEGSPDKRTGMSDSVPAVVHPVQTRLLGKTGIPVSIFGLGGEATVQARQRREEASAIIHRALDLGVNYIDTAPTYGGGGSESNIGDVLAERRDEVFLATKTHDRTYDGTMRLVEQSLQRLRTDRIDLYQVHNVRLASDLSRAFGSSGAVRALEELRSAGVIRFTGISGHRDPEVLLRGIREYPFDCLLMALNAADIHYRPFQKELLQEAVAREMGIIAMKVTAVGRLFREGGITSMVEAFGYTLSFPVSTAIVGISDPRELEEDVEIARKFEPFSSEERNAIEHLTMHYADTGNFFKHHW